LFTRLRRDVSSPPQAIAEAYKLTPTELRVLLAVVEAGGIPNIPRRSASRRRGSILILGASVGRRALTGRLIC
jgi:hypothetical protein